MKNRTIITRLAVGVCTLLLTLDAAGIPSDGDGSLSSGGNGSVSKVFIGGVILLLGTSMFAFTFKKKKV